MIPLFTHFTKKEVECPCGCGLAIVDIDLLGRLEAARIIADIPFFILSWCHCRAYNDKIGGAVDSPHLKGRAVNILYLDQAECYKLIKSFSTVGFPFIRIHAEHIYVCCDKTAAGPRFQFANY